jgi:hypothetical protein
MFLSHPLFGAGLGAHMKAQLKNTGVPLVPIQAPSGYLPKRGFAELRCLLSRGCRIFAAEFGSRHAFASCAVILFSLVLAL